MIAILNRQKKNPVRTRAFERLLEELAARYRPGQRFLPASATRPQREYAAWRAAVDRVRSAPPP
jgi:hypothetical protein